MSTGVFFRPVYVATLRLHGSRLPPAYVFMKWCDGKQFEMGDAAPLYGQHLLELETELVLYKLSYIVFLVKSSFVVSRRVGPYDSKTCYGIYK